MALTLDELRERLADPNKSLYIGPDGTASIIGDAQQKEAFQKGYKLATPEEVQHELDSKEYGDGILNEAVAGVAGAFRGASIGLSDPIIAGAQGLMGGIVGGIAGAFGADTNAADEAERWITESQDTLRGLEDQNPAISLTGEVVGAVLPAILSGGATAPGSAGALTAREVARATPAGLSAMAGRGIEGMIANKLVNFSGKSLAKNVISKGIGLGAAGVVEGGLYGAGEYISDITLDREPEFSGEALAAHMGMGAIVGGVASGVLGSTFALTPLAKNLLGGISDNIGKGMKSFSPWIAKRAKRAHSLLADYRSDAPRNEIDQLWEPVAFTQTDVPKPNAAVKSAPATAEGIESGGQIWDEISKQFKDGPPTPRPADNQIDSSKFIKEIFDVEGIPDSISIIKKLLNVNDNDAARVISATDAMSNNQKKALYDEIYKNYSTYLNKGVDSIDNVLNIIGKETDKELDIILERHATKLLEAARREGRGVNQTQAAFGQAVKLLQSSKGILSDLRAQPDLYLGRSQIRDLAVFNQQFRKKLRGLVMASRNDPDFKVADVYRFIRERRKIVDNMIRYDVMTTPPNKLGTINKIKDLRREFKEALIDQNVWGKEISRIENLNMAISEYKTAQTNFNRAFGQSQTTVGGSREYVASSKKLAAFFKNSESASNRNAYEIMSEYNTKANDLMETFRNSDDIDFWADNEVRYAREKFGLSLDKHKFLVALIEKERLFGDVGRQAAKAGLLESLPFLGGVAHGSFLAGGLGLASMPLLKFGKDPALEIRLMKKFGQSVKHMSSKISGSVKKAGNIVMTPDVVSKARVGPAAAIIGHDYFEEVNTIYDVYSQLANAFRSNPRLAESNTENAISDIDTLFPSIADTMRDRALEVSKFIIQKMPIARELDPMRPGALTEPTRLEKAKFARYMKAVNKPESVFEDMMEKGYVSQEGIEVLKTLYPYIYAKFHEQALEAIKAGKTSRAGRKMLESALGIKNGDISSAQSVYQAEDNKKQQGPGKKKGGRKLAEGAVKRKLESEEFRS